MEKFTDIEWKDFSVATDWEVLVLEFENFIKNIDYFNVESIFCSNI